MPANKNLVARNTIAERWRSAVKAGFSEGLQARGFNGLGNMVLFIEEVKLEVGVESLWE